MKIYVKPGQTYLEAAKLKGPVRQLMCTTYKANLRSGLVEQGEIVLGSYFEENNVVMALNEKGHKIYEMAYGDTMDAENTFDDEGRQVISSDFMHGKRLYTTTLFYDANGRNTGSISVNEDGTPRSSSEMRYNEKGLPIESKSYYGDGSAGAQRSVWVYDDKNQVVSHTSTRPDGVINHESRMTYDEKGNKTESISISIHRKSEKQYERSVYYYNQQNHCIQVTVFDEQGNEVRSSNYAEYYDADGKPKVKEKRGELVEGETEEFEVDHYGNWVRKTVFHKEIPISIQIRELVYFGEPERTLTHPVKEVKPKEVKRIVLKDVGDKWTEQQACWLAEHPGLPTDHFPNVRYYALKFKEMPSLISYTKSNIEAIGLNEGLIERYQAQEVHAAYTQYGSYNAMIQRYTLVFPTQPGYLLHAVGIGSYNETEYHVPQHLARNFGSGLYLSSFQLFKPSESSANRDTYFEEELEMLLESHMVERRPERPKINMIEARGGNFSVVEHAVNDSFTIKDLDVNYGHGFQQFHTDLMQRFASGTKGLVLFHGHPGTGKTYYIRHLLRQMAASKKRVIYMPPNMVDHLVDPSFMTFLLTTVKTWSQAGQYCVLLIEDAEPLLAKRQEGVRIQGVTNLLNMTDGLLNDMLNLQIVCTFNVDLRKLDSALLRPGRLIARKEFKALSELDANLLAQRLGIKHHFKGVATLGEIYAKMKNSNTLIHDVDSNKDASSHIDDLM
jgi:uncharacterized protein YpmB